MDGMDEVSLHASLWRVVQVLVVWSLATVNYSAEFFNKLVFTKKRHTVPLQPQMSSSSSSLKAANSSSVSSSYLF